jgi:hypothetical protein
MGGNYGAAVAAFSEQLEQLAADVVAAVTELRVERYDDGSQPNMVDFRLFGLDGSQVGVLEVTTSTRRDRANFNAAVHDLTWPLPGLGWDWLVWTTSTRVDLKRLQRELPGALAGLEQDSQVHELLPAQAEDTLPSSLTALGVASVAAWQLHPSGSTATATVHVHERGGFYGLATINREVQPALDDRLNQAKLASMQGGLAELFVWFDIGEGAAALDLMASPPFAPLAPSLHPPLLPQGVTGVWAGLLSSTQPLGAAALARCNTERWEVLEPPRLESSSA